MTPRKRLVAGNWKMNGDVAANEALLAALRDHVPASITRRIEVSVCPPFPYIGQAAARLAGSGISWGAQNLADAENGALTGEVSAAMLADLRCHFVIVGHSERRGLLGETDAVVASKTRRALAAGLRPIVCVGETLAQRDASVYQAVLSAQLDALADVLSDVPAAAYVIAYEPVWAIGTGRTATPEQAQQAHHWIRACLARRHGAAAQQVRVLYGGSVKSGNAQALFAMPDVDGGLIGGAALNGEEFGAICSACAKSKQG